MRSSYYRAFVLPLPLLAVQLAAQDWRRLAASEHPLPLHAVSMHYDSARDRTICLGKEQFEYTSRVTMHEWTGGGWLARDLPWIPEPGPMAFDEQRQQVVCLDGWQVLAFDGLEWESLPSTAPISVWGIPYPEPVSAAFDAQRGLLVAVDSSGSTFELHNGAWHLVGTSPPAGDAVRLLATEPTSQRVVGYAPGSGAMWRWSGIQWLSTTPTITPPARASARLLTDHVNQRVLLVAGELGAPPRTVLNDVWAWDGSDWTPSTPLPGARTEVGAAVHAGALVVVGGRLSFFGELAPPTTWIEVAGAFVTMHDVTSDALVAHDSVRGRTVALLDGSRTHEFDGYRWLDTGIVLPATARQLGFHGGSARCVALDDNGSTWLWDGQLWQLATSVGPPPRIGGGMAYDEVRDRTVLYGGATGAVTRDDTWLWDGTAWSNANPTTSPAGFPRPSLAWDPRTGTVLAGVNFLSAGTVVGALYSFDGQNWSFAGGLPSSIETLGVDASGSRVMFSFGNCFTQPAAGSPWSIRSSPDSERPAHGVLVRDTARGALVLHDFEMARQYLSSPLPATIATIGTGCAAGVVPQLLVATRPEIGSTLRLELHRGRPNDVWLPMFATAARTVALTPLCELYLEQTLLLGNASTGASGYGEFVLPLPPVPALRGLTLYAQGLQFTPGGALFGFADLTGAVELRIGD